MEAFSVTPSPPSPDDRPMLPTLLAGTADPAAAPPARTAAAFPDAPYPTARPTPRSRRLAIAGAAAVAAALVVFTTVLALRDGDAPDDRAFGIRDAGSAPPAVAEALAPPAGGGSSAERGVVSPAVRDAAPAAAPSRIASAGSPVGEPDPPRAPDPPSALERLLDPQARLEAARREFDARPEVAEALAMNAEGRTADAIGRLEWLGDRLGENPHYHYALALLYEKDRRLPKALERAARAAELEPLYAAAPDLLAMAEQGIAQNAAAAAAEAFLERALDPASALRLVERTFEENRPASVMRRIAALLDRLGLADGLPEHVRLPLLAIAAQRCPERKEILAAIRERPDPRMTPYLRRLRSDSGCGLFNRQDCYSCERSAIRAALAAVADASSGSGDGVP
jgi:tetratricopeptide (TPR) repeat protein